jgi:hypothetical protein
MQASMIRLVLSCSLAFASSAHAQYNWSTQQLGGACWNTLQTSNLPFAWSFAGALDVIPTNNVWTAKWLIVGWSDPNTMLPGCSCMLHVDPAIYFWGGYLPAPIAPPAGSSGTLYFQEAWLVDTAQQPVTVDPSCPTPATGLSVTLSNAISFTWH